MTSFTPSHRHVVPFALLALLAAACSGTSSSGAAADGDGGPDGPSAHDDARGGDDAKGGSGDAAGDDSSTTLDGGQIIDRDAGSPAAVNLGTAGDYVILAKTGISTVPPSVITGDLGVSPVAATAITGFGLTAFASGTYSTSSQVTGKVYASNYAVPTPSNLTTAIGDMATAYTDAAGRAPDVTELGAGNIGGMTLTAGVYRWASSLLIPTDVTLTGSATDVWIFQVAQKLTVDSATNVVLAGGALSKNVFWQVAGSVELGTTAQFEGNILGETAIALKTGASIDGRLLAQTAVTLEGNTVVEPAP
jgi:hypothetical protein